MAREGQWVESVEDALAGWANHDGCDEARKETRRSTSFPLLLRQRRGWSGPPEHGRSLARGPFVFGARRELRCTE
jgi:hypothetical protein